MAKTRRSSSMPHQRNFPHHHAARRTMLLTFSTNSMLRNFQNLRIGHLNVRGLERHIDGVKIILDKKQYHMFAVTETKLKSSSPIGPIRIPGYDFVKHSLPSGRGRGAKTCGGVGLYVRKGLKATTMNKSAFDPATSINQRVEFLDIRIRINDWNVCVVALYNPLSTNPNFAQLREALTGPPGRWF